MLKAKTTVVLKYKGSATSGNRMHAGRPGKVGGSSPKGVSAAAASPKPVKIQQNTTSSKEPTERDIKLPPMKLTGITGDLVARANERVKVMEQTFPGVKFSNSTQFNLLGLKAAVARGEPGVKLPQAKYDGDAQHLPAVSDSEKVNLVMSTYKTWAAESEYVNTNALKFGSGLPYQDVFGVLNHLRAIDQYNVIVSVNRMNHPVHIKINSQ